jgi:hypothetical protein
LGHSRLKDSQFRPQIRNLLELSFRNPVRPKLRPSATYRRHAPRQPFEHHQHDVWPKRERVLAGGHGHAYGRTIAMVDLISPYGRMGLAELSLIARFRTAQQVKGGGRQPPLANGSCCFRPVVPLVASANGGGWEVEMCHHHGVTKVRQTIHELARAMLDRTGNLPPQPGILPVERQIPSDGGVPHDRGGVGQSREVTAGRNALDTMNRNGRITH